MTSSLAAIAVRGLIVLGLAAATASSAAAADDASWGDVSGGVAGVTDYVARGLSLTRGRPALEGWLEWSHPIGPDVSVYAGTFMANMRFADTSSSKNLPVRIEQDLDAGLRYEPLAGMTVDLGYIRYRFPWANAMPTADSNAPDWTEVYGLLTYDSAPLRWRGGWFHSQNYSFDSGESDYVELDLSATLPWHEVLVTAHIGHLRTQDHVSLGLPDYTDISTGLSRDGPEIGGVNLALSLYATTVESNATLTDKTDTQRAAIDPRNYKTATPRVVFAVTKVF